MGDLDGLPRAFEKFHTRQMLFAKLHHAGAALDKTLNLLWMRKT